MTTQAFQKVDEYIDLVCREIQCSEVHQDVADEIRAHVLDVVEDYQAQGRTLSEAVDEALRHMGDPVTVGQGLHRAHRPRVNWVLVALVAFFAALGVVMMFAVNKAYSGQFGHTLTHQKIESAIAGIGLICGMLFVDYRRIRKSATYGFAAILLLMVITDVLGVHLLGARVLRLPGGKLLNVFALSPIVLLFCTASIMSQWKVQDWRTVAKALAIFVIPWVLYLYSREFVYLLEYTLGCLPVFAVWLSKKWRFIGYGVIGTAFSGLCLFVYATVPYTRHRVIAYLHPRQFHTDIGYQAAQARHVILSAGMWGHGFGAAYPYLPNAWTDMVFPYLVYNFGWAFGGLVIMLVGAFIYNMVKMQRRVTEPFGRSVMGGCLAVLTFQFVYHIASGLGLVPILSVNMPFVSYGSAEFIMQCLAVGCMLSVYRRKDLMPKRSSAVAEV